MNLMIIKSGSRVFQPAIFQTLITVKRELFTAICEYRQSDIACQ